MKNLQVIVNCNEPLSISKEGLDTPHHSRVYRKLKPIKIRTIFNGTLPEPVNLNQIFNIINVIANDTPNMTEP